VRFSLVVRAQSVSFQPWQNRPHRAMKRRSLRRDNIQGSAPIAHAARTESDSSRPNPHTTKSRHEMSPLRNDQGEYDT
jgi:hypothetical protein